MARNWAAFNAIRRFTKEALAIQRGFGSSVELLVRSIARSLYQRCTMDDLADLAGGTSPIWLTVAAVRAVFDSRASAPAAGAAEAVEAEAVDPEQDLAALDWAEVEPARMPAVLLGATRLKVKNCWLTLNKNSAGPVPEGPELEKHRLPSLQSLAEG